MSPLRLLPALALVVAVVTAGCARTAPFKQRSQQSPVRSQPAASATEEPGTATASFDEVGAEPYSQPGPPADSGESLEEKSPGYSSLGGEAAADPDQAAGQVGIAANSGPPASPEQPEEGLDRQTLAMMHDYLQTVPAGKREKLYEKWKTLEAAAIREKIRQRKSSTATPVSASNHSAPAASPVASAAEANDATSLATTNVVPAAFADTPQPAESAQVTQVAAEAAPESDSRPNRPVPLMEGLLSGQSPAPSSPKTSAVDTEWKTRLQKLIEAATSRAEAARTSYLAAKTKAETKTESKTETKTTTPDSGSSNEQLAALRRKYVARQVDLRLLYLMAGKQGQALQTIPDVDPATQEFWRGLLWSIASYFNAESMPHQAARMTQALERLRAAVSKLQGKAKLQLRNVAFCRRIASFGNFERFEEETYAPGQTVLLYAEVVNFESVRRESDGLFKTVLKSTIEILPEGGDHPVHRIEFEPTTDLCRSYRQDYFHSYELKIPADLEPGPYVLKLSIEDRTSGEIAIYSLNFSVE